MSGENSPLFGKHLKDDTKKKMREAKKAKMKQIERIDINTRCS